MYCGHRSWTTCCLYFRSTLSSFGRSFLDHGSCGEGRFGVMLVTVTVLSGISFVDSSWVVSVWTFFVHRGDTHHFCYFGRRVSGTLRCLQGGISVSAPCCHEFFQINGTVFKNEPCSRDCARGDMLPSKVRRLWTRQCCGAGRRKLELSLACYTLAATSAELVFKVVLSCGTATMGWVNAWRQNRQRGE